MPDPMIAQAIRKIPRTTKLGFAVGMASLGLMACGVEDPAANASAATLGDLVVDQPGFDFSTTEVVGLRLQADRPEPAALEIRTADGRKMFQGAVLQDVQLDLKLPLGTDRVQVRVAGEAAQTVQLTQGQATVGY